jgi:hypothetical protein
MLTSDTKDEMLLVSSAFPICARLLMIVRPLPVPAATAKNKSLQGGQTELKQMGKKSGKKIEGRGARSASCSLEAR